MKKPNKKIPVTILTGFLGSGKTTLLNNILGSDHGLRIAVMVNDFGAVNIDSRLVVNVKGETISLSNGCICCTIRSDLEKTAQDLLRRPQPPQYILIEASGVSDPGQVALTFVLSEELRESTIIDSVIALVDAEQYLHLKGDNAVLAERQLACSDFLILNKADLVSAARLKQVKNRIRALLPDARIREAVRGNVPLELLLGADRHTLGNTLPRDALTVHVHNAGGHGHKHKEYGHKHSPQEHTLLFDTWRYFSPKPVSCQALCTALENLPTTIYRAKGIVQIASRENTRWILQVAGTRIYLIPGGSWENTAPCTEIVFIGEAGGVDGTALQQHLDACLGTAADENIPAPETVMAMTRKE